jgi:signal transduction histidine kinase
LPDRSSLIVGDELRRPDAVMRDILWVFGWSIASMVGLGVAGGLWLSAQFLRRIDTMRIAAQGMMAGDWSRRIPSSAINDDLSSLAETFNRLFDRIEKLMLANKHVSADIAHDLRKPLARTLRRLEAARDDQAPHSAAAFETAIVDIEGVLETFNALLRIGQIEAGARRAAFKPVDLAMIVRNVVEAFQPAAEQEGKLLVVRLDSSLPMQGDKDLLSQMVANLVDNALRHTQSGVGIEVAGKLTASGGLRLSVSDNGPGVANRELNSIFQRFYRAESARQTAGTGLGLSLVAAIAELHGLNSFASDNGPGLRIEIVTEHRT